MNLGKHKHLVYETADSKAGAQKVQNKLQHLVMSKTKEVLSE